MTLPPVNSAAARPTARGQSWLAPAIWTACIVVVALVIAAFNGFAPRTDQKLTIGPGTPVPLGLAQVRIDSAAIQSSAGGFSFVIIQGAVSNTSGQPLTASAFHSAVQLAFTGSDGTLQTADGPSLGILADSDSSVSPRTVLPPIPGFVPVQFTFMVSADLPEPAPLTVGLFPVVFTQNSVLNTVQSNTWIDDQSAGHYWLVHLTA